MKFHVRGANAGAVVLSMGGQRGEGDGVGPLMVVLLPQNRSQEVVDEGDQGSVGAEGAVERDVPPTSSGHVGLDTAEHGHVSATKSVYGLFTVAYHE